MITRAEGLPDLVYIDSRLAFRRPRGSSVLAVAESLLDQERRRDENAKKSEDVDDPGKAEGEPCSVILAALRS